MKRKPNFSTSQKLLLFLAGLLGPVLIRLLGCTCRYYITGEEHHQRLIDSGEPFIYTGLHGRMLLPVYHHRGCGVVSLISYHFDGEIATRIVEGLGYIIRRGSPKVGGYEGFKEVLSDLKAGKHVAMFPDGPKGPRYKMHDGVFMLARLSGRPILPIVYSAKPSWSAKSWDKYMVMLPFSRGVLMYGEPFYIPRKLPESKTIDDYRGALESTMQELERRADKLTGLID